MLCLTIWTYEVPLREINFNTILFWIYKVTVDFTKNATNFISEGTDEVSSESLSYLLFFIAYANYMILNNNIFNNIKSTNKLLKSAYLAFLK